MQSEHPARRRESQKVIDIVSPTAFGSLGDQAMLDALTTKLTYNSYMKTRLFQTGITPSQYVLRNDIYHIKRPEIRAVRPIIFAWNVTQGNVFSMIGADIIDGSYSPGAIFQWLRMARIAHVTGSRCIILGSSCSSSPSPAVMAALKRMTFIKVLARDPISQRRFSDHLDRDVELVADLAFLLEGEIVSPNAHAAQAWISTQKNAGRTILAVNVSAESIDKLGRERGIQSYIEVLGSWIEHKSASRSVLLIPHDFRGAPPRDVQALAAIEERLRTRTRYIHFLRPPFEAWDAKALAGQVDAVFAGRMHLAIASFGAGTPVLSVAYQGKFEGLMEHLDLDREGLVLQPNDLIDTRRALAALEACTAQSGDLRAKIVKRLPRIIELSNKNIEVIRRMTGQP